MQRRQWDSKTKTKIILEGLRGLSVVDICTEYDISQAQYYKWRDIFLANVNQTVETSQKNKKNKN